MRDDARLQAAIDCLDAIGQGRAAEAVLTGWARKNRFAGSGDRAAIRDIVFDALRHWRSYAWVGGAETGRGRLLGRCRLRGDAPQSYFTGLRYGPAVLTKAEEAAGTPLETAPVQVQLDIQDWMWPAFQTDLDPCAVTILSLMQSRAPVFLRVNLARASRAEVIARLAESYIVAVPNELSPSALEVTGNARRVHQNAAYQEGLCELQDAASQAVVDAIVDLAPGPNVLDFCAGGGGKALALAAAGDFRVTAHDADAGRMADLPERARRAGAMIDVTQSPHGLFDLVLCDVPCSGSGAWRRQPEAKWRLTAEALDRLNATQDAILDQALTYLRPGGTLAYVTCSLFAAENGARALRFEQAHPAWHRVNERSWTPLDGGDGFYLAVFRES